MEVKIGVQSVAREIAVETAMSVEEVEETLTSALSTGDGVLRITDENGGQVLVPIEKLGYLEIGRSEAKRVGFGTL